MRQKSCDNKRGGVTFSLTGNPAPEPGRNGSIEGRGSPARCPAGTNLLRAPRLPFRLLLRFDFGFDDFLAQIGRLTFAVDDHPDFGHEVHGQADVHLVFTQVADRLDIDLAAVYRLRRSLP